MSQKVRLVRCIVGGHNLLFALSVLEAKCKMQFQSLSECKYGLVCRKIVATLACHFKWNNVKAHGWLDGIWHTAHKMRSVHIICMSFCSFLILFFSIFLIYISVGKSIFSFWCRTSCVCVCVWTSTATIFPKSVHLIYCEYIVMAQWHKTRGRKKTAERETQCRPSSRTSCISHSTRSLDIFINENAITKICVCELDTLAEHARIIQTLERNK